MTYLDDTFRAQKAAFRDRTVGQAIAIWHAQYEDRNRFLAQVLTLMDGAVRATATMTSGYLTTAARQQAALGGSYKGLKLDDFTVAKLRGTTGPNVYGSVYGALYGKMVAGATDEEAHAAAVAALSKLAATDVQLAYTAAAAAWLKGHEGLIGYRRILSGTCDYCESAAAGMYHGEVQMPIHENCECDVQPDFTPPPNGVAPTFLPDGSAYGTGYHLSSEASIDSIVKGGIDLDKVGAGTTFGRGFYTAMAPPKDVGYGRAFVRVDYHFKNPITFDANTQKWADVDLTGHDGAIITGYGLDGDQTILVSYDAGNSTVVPDLPFHSGDAGALTGAKAGDLDTRIKTVGDAPKPLADVAPDTLEGK